MRRFYLAFAFLASFALIAASAQAQTGLNPTNPALPASFDDRSLGWTMQFIQDKINGIGSLNFTAVFASGEKRQFKVQVTDVVADASQCHISFQWKGQGLLGSSPINVREKGTPASGFYLHGIDSITTEPGEQLLTRLGDNVAPSSPMYADTAFGALSTGSTHAGHRLSGDFVATDVRPQFTALLVHLPHNKLGFFPFQDRAIAAATAAALSHATKLCGSADPVPVMAWKKSYIKDEAGTPHLEIPALNAAPARKNAEPARTTPNIDSHRAAAAQPPIPVPAPKETEAKNIEPLNAGPAIDTHQAATGQPQLPIPAPKVTQAKDIEPAKSIPAIDSHPVAAQEVKPPPTEHPALNPGKNYALVIGIDDYRTMHHLNTAVADADAVGTILQKDYGFEVQYLHNSSRYDILAALDKYRLKLPADSNLIIYYAGHGQYLKEAEEAYWIPADGEAGGTANWIQTSTISSYSRTIPAKHILVISDSCYSGTLMREADTNFRPEERYAYVEKSFSLRSRNLMSSGSNEPVADGGGNGHSVFADVLLAGLGHMDSDAFTGSDLFKYVEVRVAGRSEQLPQYGLIRNSGDEFGDFVFVRKAAR